ncbi:hypothetical protein [Novosphingobium sp. EMRT-2]|uniref:hypothetical protein n=1 Tax=Novosphingobium sp. EMRT-2 TaxID=2571749 RepID=UPI0010BD6170|nr:hypothetical protein [Novosphingobium sp. EMRT-2]QCI92316.1 hypothetical protein FA702_01190 [Novosphingobium sp. EMRT-2]
MADRETSSLFLEVDAPTEAMRQQLAIGEGALVAFDRKAAKVAESVGRQIAKMGDQSFGPFQSSAAAAAQKVENEFASSFSRIQALASKSTANAGGGLSVGASDARAAAEAARQQAANARAIEDAVNRAALAQGRLTSAYGFDLQAARTATIAAEKRAQALALEAAQLEALEIELRQAGAAEQVFAAGGRGIVVSAGQQKAAMQQISYNLSDLGVQLGAAAGSTETAKLAFIAFTQQGTQMIQAIALLKGEASGFIGFLGSAWGAALIAAITIVGNLALAHRDAATAEGKHTDAAEELRKAIDDLHEASVREARSTQASIQADIDKANSLRQRAQEARKAAIAELQLAQTRAAAAKVGAQSGEPGSEGNSLVLPFLDRTVTDLQGQIKSLTAQISASDETIRLKRGAQIRQSVIEQTDAVSAANGRYERTLDDLNARLQRNAISEAAYRTEVLRASQARDAATEAARKSGGAGGGRGKSEATLAREAEKARLDAILKEFKDPVRDASAAFAEARGKAIEQSTQQEYDAQLLLIERIRTEDAQARQRVIDEAYRLEERKVDFLTNLFEDGMRGGVSAIWGDFEQIGTRVISRVLAQFVAAQVSGKGGGFSFGSAFGSAITAVLGFSRGGRIAGFAGGGRMISGPGTGTSDSILALVGGREPIAVSNGESINTAAATRNYWPLIEAMNAGQLPRFAAGGLVSPRLPVVRAGPAASGGDGAGGVTIQINAPGATAETVAMIRRELANALPVIVQTATANTTRQLNRRSL